MARVAAELQNVPLRDTQVLEHLPSRVGQSRRLHSPQLDRPLGDDVVKRGVCALAAQQLEQVLSKLLRRVLRLAHLLALSSASASRQVMRIIFIALSWKIFFNATSSGTSRRRIAIVFVPMQSVPSPSESLQSLPKITLSW